MKILGIESSCDDTGIAVYDDESRSLVHALHSQTELHVAYGGVVPELASRDHVRRVLPLLEQALERSRTALHEIDLVAVTAGPGLAGSLLVGCGVALGLGYALGRPVLPVHHLEGHLLSPLLADPAPSFPFVCLLVSGGHTQLLLARAAGDYELLGETLDDAAGEAFDKTAQMLGLGYPGGPAVSRLAQDGRPGACALPRPMIDADGLTMSFSGLKTAVRTAIARHDRLDDAARADISRGFVDAVVDVLAAKSLRALRGQGLRQLVVAGGVGANQQLRDRLQADLAAIGGQAYFPPAQYCTDNAAMIAFAAATRVRACGGIAQALGASQAPFAVRPRWPLPGTAAAA